jgi:uncharacterized protein with FMN-binding domain
MKIVLIVVGVLVVVVLGGLFAVTRGMKEIKQLSIGNPDVSALQDGVYEGSYHKSRWNYGVRLTVKDGRIENVEFTEKPDDGEFSQAAAQALLQSQSVRIDTVSGASVNTRAFQKAVENALSEAPKR